jgi:hypothetical protein
MAEGQSVNFDLKTSKNIEFDFNTINKYVNGIIAYNACELNVNVSGTQWDMYVGATTSKPGYWDVTEEYSNSGDYPPISILQLRINNSSNTSQVPGFFPLTDISSPTYLIGSAGAPDAAVNCPDQGTNQPGDYNSSPGCYKFRVDMKITPGLSTIYKAGLYTLRIDYILIQDL